MFTPPESFAVVFADDAVFERIRPVMDCYAKASTLIGPVGSGQLAKMVNQICIAGLVQGLSEGLHFAEKAGLDGRAVIDVIGGRRHVDNVPGRDF